MSKSGRTRQQARERIAQQRALEQRRRRRRNWLLGVGAAVVVVVAIGAVIFAVTRPSGAGQGTASGGSPSGGNPELHLSALSSLGTLQPAGPAGPTGPEGVPVPQAPPLASTATKATGQNVDGIMCQTSEQLVFHIHAHLTLFVNGSPRQVPAGIGVPGARAQQTAQGPFVTSGTCFYWLHTHAGDGIIHIESPVHRTYTLGEFFDEWGQALGPGQVGPARGHVTAIYNGKAFTGNPRDIPLTAHAQIQLEVGKPLVAPESITWPSGL